VSELTGYALLTTAAATGLLHTLIPDHWLPFVLIGKARGWSAATVGAVSGLSALIHTAFSLLLGLLAVGLGLKAVDAVGESLERASAILLCVLGLAYAGWAWRKGRHFHPGGRLLHGREPRPACEGGEGDANPEHLHYHADEGLIRGRHAWGAVALALIIGLNPCVLMLPVLLASVQRGASMVALTSLAYAVPTILLMVGLSVLGVRTAWRVRLPWVARRAESISGLVVAALGFLYAVLGG
jgi:ABC-type nickel/cobalt efflux system permease component RcnA